MDLLEIITVGRYGITKELADFWNAKVAFKNCWQKNVCCCGHGVTIGQEEAEKIAFNSSAIMPYVAKHLQDKHALELLESNEDGELATGNDEDHPLGPTCTFIDDEGACTLHKLAFLNTGLGDKVYGLKPTACILYPIREFAIDDFVDHYGAVEGYIGDNFVVFGFDKFSDVGLSKQRCLKEGDTPFHELMKTAFQAVLGHDIQRLIYEAVEAYLDGNSVGLVRIPCSSELADSVANEPYCINCNCENSDNE